MKIHLINRYQAYMIKIRASLGDQDSPIDEIRRPPGMTRQIFKKKIERLRKYDEKIAILIMEGLKQYR